MSLLIKLYSSTLDSNSSPLPINIKRPFYEITVKDLLNETYELLSGTYKAPYNQIKRGYIVVSIYYAKAQKYMSIDKVKETTLLSELHLLPGGVIHVQDSRLISGSKQTTKKQLKDVSKFVREDFKSSRSARASMISNSSFNSHNSDKNQSEEDKQNIKEADESKV